MNGSQKAANVPHAGETGHSSFVFCQICSNYGLLNGKFAKKEIIWTKSMHI